MTIFAALRIAYACCLIVTVAVGIGLGGRSERTGAFIVLAASAATIAIEHPLLFDWSRNRTGLIVVDLIALGAFLRLALKTERFWPLWATAFHLIAVCSHAVILISPNRVLQVYALLQGAWAYPINALIVVAALRHRGRSRARTPVTTG